MCNFTWVLKSKWLFLPHISLLFFSRLSVLALTRMLYRTRLFVLSSLSVKGARQWTSSSSWSFTTTRSIQPRCFNKQTVSAYFASPRNKNLSIFIKTVFGFFFHRNSESFYLLLKTKVPTSKPFLLYANCTLDVHVNNIHYIEEPRSLVWTVWFFSLSQFIIRTVITRI